MSEKSELEKAAYFACQNYALTSPEFYPEIFQKGALWLLSELRKRQREVIECGGLRLSGVILLKDVEELCGEHESEIQEF